MSAVLRFPRTGHLRGVGLISLVIAGLLVSAPAVRASTSVPIWGSGCTDDNPSNDTVGTAYFVRGGVDYDSCTIKTDAHGLVHIKLNNGSAIDVGPSSYLEFSGAPYGGADLSLSSGQIRFVNWRWRLFSEVFEPEVAPQGRATFVVNKPKHGHPTRVSVYSGKVALSQLPSDPSARDRVVITGGFWSAARDCCGPTTPQRFTPPGKPWWL